nr:hypothetical protein [Mesorhizobium loti]
MVGKSHPLFGQLLLRNVGDIVLEPTMEEALETVAVEMMWVDPTSSGWHCANALRRDW